jgi:cystathionine gamma-synthase
LQQSESAFKIVEWLTSKSEPCLDIVNKVWHASLPLHPGHEAMKRQGCGWSGVFSMDLCTPNQARLLCSNTQIFINATSLGGVESKVEWRAAVDSKIDPTLVRVNVGLEDFEDLIDDFRQAFLEIAQY